MNEVPALVIQATPHHASDRLVRGVVYCGSIPVFEGDGVMCFPDDDGHDRAISLCQDQFAEALLGALKLGRQVRD